MGFQNLGQKKRNKHTYTTNLVNGNISPDEKYIKLPKIEKIKIKLHRPIPADYKLKSVTVTKNPAGTYYVSILFEYRHEINPIQDIGNVLGLNCSSKDLYVASVGILEKTPNFLELLKKT